MNTGLEFIMAIFKVCKRFINTEEFPNSFNITTLIQIPKKGSLTDLDNSRFMHMKHLIPRLCEDVAVGRMKDEIISAGIKYQIGGKGAKEPVLSICNQISSSCRNRGRRRLYLDSC